MKYYCLRYPTVDRNEKIYDAHVKYGYTLKEISDFPGIHYTTVSKVIQKEGQK